MNKQERFPLSPLLLLPSLLLFLCPEDCLSLSGTREVIGTVGETLTVQCFYEKAYKNAMKYWCRKQMLILCDKTVISTSNGNGRVSVRDHPENQTFIITMKNLTEADEGAYWCGIDILGLDSLNTITVSVVPAPRVTPNTYTTTLPTEIPMTNETEREKTSEEISDHKKLQRPWILEKPGILLSVLGFLIILLVGALFLTWRLIVRQKKANEKSMVFPDSDQMNNEPFYANMELQERCSNQDPLRPNNPSVENSTGTTDPEQSIIYSTLAFPMDNKNTALESQEYQEEKAVYSRIMKK
ncbi:CMRF35-like molecule 8 isoform X2 [Monodelphis domestica]|uniref:CMRF35-like molecule 8 isoform X2 n=1 Tax=Monodelphis domestica TaxID=13616 RepID=UPI0004432ACD|nr:CMRF35-like molecule 8 isoform X2 [Monodelphis domestica]